MRSIYLYIPGVMNPTLSPFSISYVDLQAGQEVFLIKKTGNRPDLFLSLISTQFPVAFPGSYGTIKNDFLYHYQVQNLVQAKEALKKAVRIYNDERPHSSIGNLTPSLAHQIADGKLKNLWKPNKSCKTISGLNNNCKLIPGLNVKPVNFF